MKNDIQESYCSFEVSKLIKEKGFAVNCNEYYNLNNGIFLKDRHWSTLDYSEQIIAPTHTIAIEWIRVNFNIEIEIYRTHICASGEKYGAQVQKWFNDEEAEDLLNDYFKNPKEATEAALLYTLTKIINP